MMKLLIERGYKEVTPSDVMVREIDDITMPEGDITFYNKPVEEWLCAYFEYEGFTLDHQNKDSPIIRKENNSDIIFSRYFKLDLNATMEISNKWRNIIYTQKKELF